MIYCDTSFLAALYLPEDVFEPVARPIAAGWDRGIPFPWLSEIELCTTIYRGIGRNLYDKSACTAILRQISSDKAAGILSPRLLDSMMLFNSAMDLSKRFTATHQCRTLDILHVAAALEFKAKTMASFDNRQRQLASSTGLSLLPEVLGCLGVFRLPQTSAALKPDQPDKPNFSGTRTLDLKASTSLEPLMKQIGASLLERKYAASAKLEPPSTKPNTF